MSSADLSRLTAIFHVGALHASVDRLVRSFRRIYPTVKLLVADDSRQPREVAGADLVKLPPDVGTGAARNALLARVRTPYFLLLEDGVELTRRSRIESLLAPVIETRFDLVGGEYLACTRKWLVLTSRAPHPGHATFEYEGDVLRLAPNCRPGLEGVQLCDLTHNFFVGRTDKVRTMGGWDTQLLVDERIEFFVRARRFGLRVGLCPQTTADFWIDAGIASRARRGRNYQSLAAAKIGVARLIDLEGRVHEAASQGQNRAA